MSVSIRDETNLKFQCCIRRCPPSQIEILNDLALRHPDGFSLSRLG